MTSFCAVPPVYCRPRTILFTVLLLVCLPFRGAAAPDPDLFPEYPSISINVAFWEKIYSTYSANTAIIHDRDDLRIIYTIIALLDRNQPGARQKNEVLIEKTKTHYADMLRRLARTGPQNAEERRIGGLFGAKTAPAAFQQATDNIRAQTGLKEQFLEGVIRSGAYLPAFKQIFRTHGLPEDLAYLPHVESSFNPRAFSRFGASGMWQFTTDTGKEYLRIDYIIDERRDPFLSAEAAARLLGRNHRVLGSWPLALTSYNYGVAGMKRAVAEQGDYESIFRNYRKGWFKFAARNFYPSFVAAVRVAKQLERSGTLVLNRPMPTVAIRLPGYTDSAALCRHLGISRETLLRHNLALREPVLDGHKYIPKDYLLKLPAQLKNSPLLANFPPSLFKTEQRRSAFYQVRPGDTAGAVALAHKVTLQSLIEVNGLDRQASIRVGQNLRIPPPARVAPSQSLAQATPAIVILKDTKKSQPVTGTATLLSNDLTVVGNLKVFELTQNGRLLSGSIEVQPDETIKLLAHWVRATPQSIHLANRIADQAEIQPGQLLTLDFLEVSIEAFETARFDFHQEKQEDFFKSYGVVDLLSYTVNPGDTLWDLCYNKFEIPLWLLKKFNDNLNFRRLDPGGILRIPVVRDL